MQSKTSPFASDHINLPMIGVSTKSEIPSMQQSESLYSLAERRLRELVEAGNIEAIRLALSMNPTQATIC